MQEEPGVLPDHKDQREMLVDKEQPDGPDQAEQLEMLVPMACQDLQVPMVQQ